MFSNPLSISYDHASALPPAGSPLPDGLLSDGTALQLVTSEAVHEVSVRNEGRDMWRTYLEHQVLARFECLLRFTGLQAGYTLWWTSAWAPNYLPSCVLCPFVLVCTDSAFSASDLHFLIGSCTARLRTMTTRSSWQQVLHSGTLSSLPWQVGTRQCMVKDDIEAVVTVLYTGSTHVLQ